MGWTRSDKAKRIDLEVDYTEARSIHEDLENQFRAGETDSRRRARRPSRCRYEVDGKPVTTWHQTAAEELYWMEMEWSALHLVRGCDPYFALDETGAFVTPDGRFALSRERREDLRGFMGPRTVELQKAIANTPERWGQSC